MPTRLGTMNCAITLRKTDLIQGVYRDRKKGNQWLYWPLVALIRLMAKLTPRQRRADRWTDELASDPVLLGGNTIIIHSILK